MTSKKHRNTGHRGVMTCDTDGIEQCSDWIECPVSCPKLVSRLWFLSHSASGKFSLTDIL